MLNFPIFISSIIIYSWQAGLYLFIYLTVQRDFQAGSAAGAGSVQSPGALVQGPSTWALLSCLPRCLSRELHQNWICQDKNWCPRRILYMSAAIQHWPQRAFKPCRPVGSEMEETGAAMAGEVEGGGVLGDRGRTLVLPGQFLELCEAWTVSRGCTFRCGAGPGVNWSWPSLPQYSSTPWSSSTGLQASMPEMALPLPAAFARSEFCHPPAACGRCAKPQL